MDGLLQPDSPAKRRPVDHDTQIATVLAEIEQRMSVQTVVKYVHGTLCTEKGLFIGYQPVQQYPFEAPKPFIAKYGPL